MKSVKKLWYRMFPYKYLYTTESGKVVGRDRRNGKMISQPK